MNRSLTERTLVDLLRDRAARTPNQVAYTFLENGERESDSLTYRQLDDRARAIAVVLQARLTSGDRVLLVYPQSLEAIAALFGCLYAGMIAIPAPAPEAARMKRVLPRLEAIAADAEASLILTTASLLAGDSSMIFQVKSSVHRLNGRVSLLLDYQLTKGAIAHSTPQLATLPWVASDRISPQFAAQWQLPQITGETMAYLQYTSGSTATPKGVMLDHQNLMAHLGDLQKACGYDPESVTVTWMPYFHDYGLVEGILEPLYNGTPCYLLSPLSFIKQPRRWLDAISIYRATHSQAPNFAYAYCLQRIATAERVTLDLSSWQMAANAAEPINPETIEQFCESFGSCGFRRSAFAPAYGLAEATLLVTTSPKRSEPEFATVSATALIQNRVVEEEKGKRLVSSGRLLGNTTVAIVNPETLERCAADEIGEIWVASLGVARGYWQRPDATQETFRATLVGESGLFLRTGDLGFLRDGELFVTGRLKDLIIMRGENYYPQDLEWTVERCHAALRSGYGAAFSIEVDRTEQLVIAFEVERSASKNLNVDEVVSAIRNAVAENYELSVYAVVLLKRGGLLKTSSGKVQRQACRQTWLDGSLDSLAIWMIASIANDQKETVPQTEAEILLVQIWQNVLGITDINTNDNFFEIGGDSLKAAIVVGEIEAEIKKRSGYDIHIPLASLVEAPTIAKLALHIIKQYYEKCCEEVNPRSLVPIKPNGNKRPWFYVHGVGGNVGSRLTNCLNLERPIYGLQAVGLDGKTPPHTCMKKMVDYYIQEIQTVQPEGPYLLGGFCIGGNIAFEMAQQLKRQGQQVLLVTMIDSLNPLITEDQKTQRWNSWISSEKQRERKKLMNSGLSINLVENILKVWEANYQVIINHVPQAYSGRVAYFSAIDNRLESYRYQFDPMEPNGWNDWVLGGVELYEVSGNHLNIDFRVLVEQLNACLEQTEQEYEQEKVLLNPSQIQSTKNFTLSKQK